MEMLDWIPLASSASRPWGSDRLQPSSPTLFFGVQRSGSGWNRVATTSLGWTVTNIVIRRHIWLDALCLPVVFVVVNVRGCSGCVSGTAAQMRRISL